MKLAINLLAATILLSLSSLSWADLPFNILSQNTAVVTDVKAENMDVWIKLASAHDSDIVTVRISNRNKDFYRTWFHGNVDLVSTGFRGSDVWSDRVQTQAKYIEYWVNDELVLHLERK